MTHCDALQELLHDHPGGTVDLRTAFGRQVLSGLAEVWASLAGCGDQKTTAEKIYRAENFCWLPPSVISFRLERHGATINGSSRAEIHCWHVNLDDRAAHIARKTYRQVWKSDSRMNCAAWARDIASIILARKDHFGLVWSEERQNVTLKLEILIPTTYAQTTSGRRKRFRESLVPLLAELGWDFCPKGTIMHFFLAK